MCISCISLQISTNLYSPLSGDWKQANVHHRQQFAILSTLSWNACIFLASFHGSLGLLLKITKQQTRHSCGFFWILPPSHAFLHLLLLLHRMITEHVTDTICHTCFAKKHLFQSQGRMGCCLIQGGLVSTENGSAQSWLIPKSINWMARSIWNAFWPHFLKNIPYIQSCYWCKHYSHAITYTAWTIKKCGGNIVKSW